MLPGSRARAFPIAASPAAPPWRFAAAISAVALLALVIGRQREARGGRGEPPVPVTPRADRRGRGGARAPALPRRYYPLTLLLDPGAQWPNAFGEVARLPGPPGPPPA